MTQCNRFLFIYSMLRDSSTCVLASCWLLESTRGKTNRPQIQTFRLLRGKERPPSSRLTGMSTVLMSKKTNKGNNKQLSPCLLNPLSNKLKIWSLPRTDSTSNSSIPFYYSRHLPVYSHHTPPSFSIYYTAPFPFFITSCLVFFLLPPRGSILPLFISFFRHLHLASFCISPSPSFIISCSFSCYNCVPSSPILYSPS